MEVFNNIKKQFDVSQIINKENTNNSNRDLEEVAQEFESLFINEMILLLFVQMECLSPLFCFVENGIDFDFILIVENILFVTLQSLLQMKKSVGF